MTISTEPTRGGANAGLTLLLLAALTGCATPGEEAVEKGGESWSVTAWGERFEIFPEVDPLIAGEPATAHTHVTRLGSFEPLVQGEVSIVVSGSADEQVFSVEEASRPGIFAVEITPERAGDYDLSFRIRDEAGVEEIRGGRVRVGTAESPGSLIVAPAPKGGSDGGEPLSFLKEQQWRSDFGTAWVRRGSLAGSVAGLATVRPPAWGEATITAPVDGVVQSPPGIRSWPFVGLVVDRGQPLFRVSPLVASDRSLPALEAELASFETEFETARARLNRLEELLALEAASRREVEEARARVETLTSRRSAAGRDLEAARSARGGGASPNGLVLRAPFAGEVARVSASPGVTVKAGDALARLVGSDAVWIEVQVPPAGARRLAAEGVRGVVLSDPEHGPVRLEEGVQLISIAPEVSPETGTVTVLLETPRGSAPELGTTAEAQVLSAVPREGIVIPSTALVDDGGVPVVYLQLSGESFVRQEVTVLERQGDRILVDHLVPGQRLVTRGGDAIRRASLMTSGEAQGHVH
jgi:RND family efflux transporter MFP subunit